MKSKPHQRILFPSSSTKKLNPYQSSLSSSRKKTAQQLEQNVEYVKKSFNEHLNINQERVDLPINNLLQKERKVIESRQRLKNIHHFYRIRIEEQRKKNTQRNEIFIGVIQQLQRNHSDKIILIQNSIQELNEQKKDINYVDERMVSIKNTIEDILTQSKQFKQMNEAIQKQIIAKQHIYKQKQSQYISMKEQLDQLRNKLQQFQRLKLKENKRNRQMMQMIQTTL